MIALFGIAWLLRLDGAMHNATALPLVLEVAAVVVSFGGAWLGGELVERLSIGVDEDAYPDAANSLRSGATPERAGARSAR
jgi:uncharacterized membrane protein